MKKPRLVDISPEASRPTTGKDDHVGHVCSLRWMVPALRWKTQHSHLQKATLYLLPCNSRLDLDTHVPSLYDVPL
jgi:hypothetical protein